jgi:hypothetical protein
VKRPNIPTTQAMSGRVQVASHCSPPTSDLCSPMSLYAPLTCEAPGASSLPSAPACSWHLPCRTSAPACAHSFCLCETHHAWLQAELDTHAYSTGSPRSRPRRPLRSSATNQSHRPEPSGAGSRSSTQARWTMMKPHYRNVKSAGSALDASKPIITPVLRRAWHATALVPDAAHTGFADTPSPPC